MIFAFPSTIRIDKFTKTKLSGIAAYDKIVERFYVENGTKKDRHS